MDNIGYEEFPKLTNEADTASECRELEDARSEAVGGARSSSPPPPVYTPSATPVVYPQEPPPAYFHHLHHQGTPVYHHHQGTQVYHHHQSQLSMYSLPPYHQSSYIPGSGSSTIDGSAHGHFGVLIDGSSSSSGLPPPIVVTDPPTDYLAPSIFNLLFCCIIFGLFGLVKSIATRAAVQVGDYELAYIHAMEARNWNIAASVTGGILWALAILALVVVFTV